MLTTVQELEEEQASEYGSLIKISQMQLSTLRYIKRSTKSNLSFVIVYI
uniref:CSON006700 protein n=1 Tax=Culicoides sonorensis TaxID=179676 RepID=A0A336MTS2_CULSO